MPSFINFTSLLTKKVSPEAAWVLISQQARQRERWFSLLASSAICCHSSPECTPSCCPRLVVISCVSIFSGMMGDHSYIPAFSKKGLDAYSWGTDLNFDTLVFISKS